MARTRTLADMVTDVRQRTNQENSDLCSDDEIGEYLNQELAELWSHVVQGSGQPYYRVEAPPIDVTVGTALYSLPADFWRAQELVAKYNGRTFKLRPFMTGERAGLIDSIDWPGRPWECEMYRIQGEQIEFLPNRHPMTVTLFYTPNCPRLALTGSFDGINGWEVAAIYGACATVQAKEETDPSFYAGQRERIYKMIDSMVPHRDGGETERIQDVRASRRNGWIW
jgi:hypothetical protein